MGLFCESYTVESVKSRGFDYDITLQWYPGRLWHLLGAKPYRTTYRGMYHWRIYPTSEPADIFHKKQWVQKRWR